MTEADILERAAFWQVGLMDVDHLRDVAYEALESPFDCTEFRSIAGDGRLEPEDARDLLEVALRAAGLSMPDEKLAERIVVLSVARSICAGAIEPMWGAGIISRYTHDEHPSPIFGPLLAGSCPGCNGLDGIQDPVERAKEEEEVRDYLLDHLRDHLPAIRAWTGSGTIAEGPLPPGPGFLGWRRLPGRPETVVDMGHRVDDILFRSWDPIGVSPILQARDEYSSYVPQVVQILRSEGTKEEKTEALRGFLRTLEAEWMGLQESDRRAHRREAAIRELLSLLE